MSKSRHGLDILLEEDARHPKLNRRQRQYVRSALNEIRTLRAQLSKIAVPPPDSGRKDT